MTFNEAISPAKTLDQKSMSIFYKNIGSQEKEYTKKDLTFNYIIAQKLTPVETIIDGKKETSNKANKGDYILTGSRGEKYVLTPEKFNSKYDIVSDSQAKTKPVKIMAKEYQGDLVKFMADWGEEMILESGDFLVNNNGEYYRIEKQAFHNTYK